MQDVNIINVNTQFVGDYLGKSGFLSLAVR
jgi:hypothetical protein